MITIRLIDKTADPAVCNALPAMASLVSLQVNKEFNDAWEVGPVQVGVGNAPLDGEWPCFIVPSLDDPNALAYHDEEQTGTPGLYVGRDVILQKGGTMLDGSNSILAALSHEVLEALVDPWCTWYSDWTDERMVALEVCDPVENDGYQVRALGYVGTVSNFVLPEWFRASPNQGKFDHLGSLSAPLTLSPGGYVAFRDGTQSFGKDMNFRKRTLKQRTGRRARRRRHAR